MIFTLDSYREKVFPGWGLDWDKIRASQQDASFNVYNFSQHRLETLAPAQMSEDFLVACVSLPMWFPAVPINGHTYIDPVYITDANLEEAIARGADEIWVVWTVSEKGEWNSGFVAQYFQIIETSANGHFRRIQERITANNAAIVRGERGEFGRPIEVKVLRAEVPLHYLINLSADRLHEAVNQGVARARAWCAEQGIALTGQPAPAPARDATTLEFTEEMKGFVTAGAPDYDRGFRDGRAADNDLMFHLTIKVEGVSQFLTDPDHEASATGYIEGRAVGGRLPVERGIFNLFTDRGDPAHRYMLYRLFVTDAAGQPLTLSGYKDIKDDRGFDVWGDTTTLFTKLLRGHVSAADEPTAEVVATGIITIHLLDFMKQLTTFKTTGPTLGERVALLGRFGALFMGKLWDVYAEKVLSSGPI